MSRIIQVISFKRSADNFIVEVKKNKYCQEIIQIPEKEFTLFLERHERLDRHQSTDLGIHIYTIQIDEYLNSEPLASIYGDLADYIICKVIDFDIIFSDIFNHIQKLAKC